MLANKDKRDHLVARMTDPSRLIGDSLGFMEIFDGMENALFTVAQGEIKAPTDEQLKGMTQEQQNEAWKNYKDKKEHQGVINTSSAVEMDNSVKDFTVATRQNIIGVNHDGGLNLLSFGEGNNLVENYQRLQDGRYNTLDGRANLSNQIQYTGQDGKNKDGVDILNNATLYSVDGNQAAMQYLVDGMTGRTDIDAALYSQTVKTGLPGEAKAVAINNNETNTHIVGVNIDKTDLQNQSDFITSIAEETRHSTNPNDHNANQYAAQAAYVWREENINEGRQTGQGVGINQWRADNKDDATIAKNNVTIGSQRARDMEFRQLAIKEIDFIANNAKTYADKEGITEEQARQELTQQALMMVDATWASQDHIKEKESARKFLLEIGKDESFTLSTPNGFETVNFYQATEKQYNDKYLLASGVAKIEGSKAADLPTFDFSTPLIYDNSLDNWYSKYATANGVMPEMNVGMEDLRGQMGNNITSVWDKITGITWADAGNYVVDKVTNEPKGSEFGLLGQFTASCIDNGLACALPDSMFDTHGAGSDRAYIDKLTNNQSAFLQSGSDSIFGATGDTLQVGTFFSPIGLGSKTVVYGARSERTLVLMDEADDVIKIGDDVDELRLGDGTVLEKEVDLDVNLVDADYEQISGSKLSHINGAIGEANGYRIAQEKYGHIGLQAPGKVT